MKRQQRTVGAFVEIKLTTGQFAYARILDKACFAVYDLISDHQVDDVITIGSKPVLFIVAVYDYAVNKGRWHKIGKLPLEDQFHMLPMQFIQDGIDPNLYSLYNPNTGEITPSSKNSCVGLEAAAVWEPEHVESRIEDFYAQRPNVWVDQLSL
jgi:hypothetical protein